MKIEELSNSQLDEYIALEQTGSFLNGLMGLVIPKQHGFTLAELTDEKDRRHIEKQASLINPPVFPVGTKVRVNYELRDWASPFGPTPNVGFCGVVVKPNTTTLEGYSEVRFQACDTTALSGGEVVIAVPNYGLTKC